MKSGLAFRCYKVRNDRAVEEEKESLVSHDSLFGMYTHAGSIVDSEC